jgi:hypothetical protein
MFRCLAKPRPRYWCRAAVPTLLLATLLLVPRFAWACACGCGVFEVGTSSMFPSGAGGTIFYGLDFQDQSRNWSGGHRAPSGNNDDKDLRTFFNTLGVQYMFNRNWGVQVEVPIWDRTFKSDVSGGNGAPDIVSTSWTSLGDIRIRGIYTGFSDDLSTGVTYGIKLPTGNFKFNSSVVDSDTQIGTGSTDLLLGAFHRQALTTDNMWSWFAQAQLDVPVLIQNQYRPGSELDFAAGVHYNGWMVGTVQITPIAQAIVALRGRDSGANAASPVASGYQRLILAPGIEVDFSQFSVYADVEVPVLESFNGNQLAAPVMFKLLLSYNF